MHEYLKTRLLKGFELRTIRTAVYYSTTYGINKHIKYALNSRYHPGYTLPRTNQSSGGAGKYWQKNVERNECKARGEQVALKMDENLRFIYQAQVSKNGELNHFQFVF